MTMTDAPLGLNWPGQVQPQLPPEPVRNTSPWLDTSSADEVLVGGSWLPIQKGSLEPPPERYAALGLDVPLWSYLTPTGDRVILKREAIMGWRPIPLPE